MDKSERERSENKPRLMRMSYCTICDREEYKSATKDAFHRLFIDILVSYCTMAEAAENSPVKTEQKPKVVLYW